MAEEIARVRGYELVPSETPDTAMAHYRPSPLEVRELVRETLAGAGLTEVVTTALVSPRHVETFAMRSEVPSIGDEPQPGGDPIGVGNPLSRDHSLLRRNLLGSLLDVVGVNLRHGTPDVAVFEIGKGYARVGDEPREWWRLAFALVGRRRARRLEPRPRTRTTSTTPRGSWSSSRAGSGWARSPTWRRRTSPCSTRAAPPGPRSPVASRRSWASSTRRSSRRGSSGRTSG